MWSLRIKTVMSDMSDFLTLSKPRLGRRHGGWSTLTLTGSWAHLHSKFEAWRLAKGWRLVKVGRFKYESFVIQMICTKSIYK